VHSPREAIAFRNSSLDLTNAVPYSILFSTAILIGGSGRMLLLAKTQSFMPPSNWKDKLKITICCLLSRGYCWTCTGLGPSRHDPQIWEGVNELSDNTEIRSRTACQTRFPITL